MVKDTENIREFCIDNNDAYREICNKLVKLCPRLVPSPLWGLSLAKVSRMAPQAALSICDECPEIVEEIHRYWVNLDRSGRCEVCGEPGSEIDEDWLYCIFDEKGNLVSGAAIRDVTLKKAKNYKGIAYLQGFRLLCGKCHLAKHQGYALVHGRRREALEHLAWINQLSLEETRKLVGKAFFIHRQLSKINDWTIKIGELKGLNEKLRKSSEELLNTMYRKGLSISEGWLYYQYPRYYEEVEPRVINEAISVLADASKRSGTTKIVDDKWIDCLLRIVKEELESKGIQVLSHEFKLFMKYLLENERQKNLLQRVVDYISRSNVDHHKGLTSLLLNYMDLTGKWMVFVSTSLYPRIFRYMLDALEKSKLAYMAKITSRREEYISGNELPIIIYVPISFAAQYVVEVAEVMKSVLDEFGISKKLFFKPDLFTEKGIYSGRGSHKSYIYVY